MRTIHKHILSFDGETVIPLPIGARPVLVGTDQESGFVAIWLELVSNVPDDQRIERKFRIYPTGSDIPDTHEACHVGSAICAPFVWHVYEALK